MSNEKVYRIQEFRARLNPEGLAAEKVWFLVFPYHEALNNFLKQMASFHRNKLPYWKRPPWRWLNALLVATVPSLVHPFIKGLSKNERHMLILDGFPRPDQDQIKLLIQVWIERWVERCFSQERRRPEGEEAYQQLLAGLASPATQWQWTTAGEIMGQYNHPLTYTALPSLLAARLAGKESTIHIFQRDGKDEAVKVKWQLAQRPGSNRLILVSNPVLSHYEREYDEKLVITEGHYAYLVEFMPHTVPGDREPFIHIQVSCRRYVEKPVTRFLYGRATTVMVGLRQPRVIAPDWPGLASAAPEIFIPLRIRGIKDIRWWWDDRIVELLLDLKKAFGIYFPHSEQVDVRPLLSPSVLGKNPRAYWGSDDPAETMDRYFLLYAEGIKPRHALGTSYSTAEFYGIWQAILAEYRETLSPEPPLIRDAATAKLGKTVSMMSFWDLNEPEIDKATNRPRRRRVSTPLDEKHKIRHLDEAAVRTLTTEAVNRVYGQEPVTVLLLYVSQEMYEKKKQQLTQCSLFPRITVQGQRIDGRLVASLNSGGIDPDELAQPEVAEEERVRQHRERQTHLMQAQAKRKESWKQFLQPLLPERGAAFVLIEIPEDSWEDPDASPRGAIRGASVDLALGSQLLSSLTGNESVDQSRIKNAIADLLVRQTGLIHGDIRELYCQAGIPAPIAKQLTVIGLYRHRSNTYGLDYPLAVRILPQGRVEMLLPDDKQSWQPYESAQFALGQLFLAASVLKRDERENILKLKPEIIERFVAHICLNTKGPTLIFLEATDFRNVWQQMQNPHLQEINKLIFSTESEPFLPADVPDTWVVRLREAGNLSETPQYVRLYEDPKTQEETLRFADGLYIVGPSGEFTVYHSIGRGPTHKREAEIFDYAKVGEGGRESFKHHHVLEIIPFFLSSGIEQDALARTGHFLRSIPSWENGNILLPLPNHLARKAIGDYLCLLPRVDEES